MRFLGLFELEVDGVVLPLVVAKNFLHRSVGVDEMYEVRGNPDEDLWVLPNLDIVLLDANFDCRAIGVENESDLEKMRACLQDDIEFLTWSPEYGNWQDRCRRDHRRYGVIRGF